MVSEYVFLNSELHQLRKSAQWTLLKTGRPAYLHELCATIPPPRDGSHFIEVYLWVERWVAASLLGMVGRWVVSTSQRILNGGTPLVLLTLLMLLMVFMLAEVLMQKALKLLIQVEVDVIQVLVYSQPFILAFHVKGFGHLTDRGVFFDLTDIKLWQFLILMLLMQVIRNLRLLRLLETFHIVVLIVCVIGLGRVLILDYDLPIWFLFGHELDGL